MIFNFPEGKFRDTLLEQWMDIPSMALNDQVAPAAFITDKNKRIHHFIRISNHPKASLEARYHCAILLDKGAEKSKLLAELNHIPEGKAYLEKAYKLLREYYPMVQDLDDLSIKAKIPAIYPNCTHNTDYLAFRASIPTVSLK